MELLKIRASHCGRLSGAKLVDADCELRQLAEDKAETLWNVLCDFWCCERWWCITRTRKQLTNLGTAHFELRGPTGVVCRDTEGDTTRWT